MTTLHALLMIFLNIIVFAKWLLFWDLGTLMQFIPVIQTLDFVVIFIQYNALPPKKTIPTVYYMSETCSTASVVAGMLHSQTLGTAYLKNIMACPGRESFRLKWGFSEIYHCMWRSHLLFHWNSSRKQPRITGWPWTTCSLSVYLISY